MFADFSITKLKLKMHYIIYTYIILKDWFLRITIGNSASCAKLFKDPKPKIAIRNVDY